MQAYSEIIVREKAYEPRYFIRVRMLIVWRREEDVLRLRLESIGSGRGCGEGRGRKGPLPRTTSASHDLRRMPDFSPPLSAAKKPAQGGPLLAQRRGFEPPDESPPSHDFQSCSLNHSDISACRLSDSSESLSILHDFAKNCKCFSGVFAKFPKKIPQRRFRPARSRKSPAQPADGRAFSASGR